MVFYITCFTTTFDRVCTFGGGINQIDLKASDKSWGGDKLPISTDVVVIGGGLAGLCLALDLQQRGVAVVVVEKDAYPRHKVCGEYVSKEILPYWERLELDWRQLGAVDIDGFELVHTSGNRMQTPLPLGGIGVSRYALDRFLHAAFVSRGGQVVQATADAVDQVNGGMEVTLSDDQIIHAELVVGAYGKRSKLDKQLGRAFFKERTEWVGVKYHARGEWPQERVSLFLFDGGYCGVSSVENGKVNVCYLIRSSHFKLIKDPAQVAQSVLYQNPGLSAVLSGLESEFDAPLTISQIYFGEKSLYEDGVLFCGDSAGMIHPLAGNGMAMAMQGAAILAPLIQLYLGSKMEPDDLVIRYKDQWRAAFQKRLAYGRVLQQVLLSPRLGSLAIKMGQWWPRLAPKIIQQTHGHR